MFKNVLQNWCQKSENYHISRLNLPTLEYRRQRGDLIISFKMLHNIDDFEYSKMLTLSSTPHDLRENPSKLQKPRANKSIRINSFSHRVVNNWYKLTSTVLCARM